MVLELLVQRSGAVHPQHVDHRHQRAIARRLRNAQVNKNELSREIVARFMALPEYAAAKWVMFYVDVRSEVRTRNDLALAIASGKQIVVPYCVEGELELFHLENMNELELGMYKILEPKANDSAFAEFPIPI